MHTLQPDTLIRNPLGSPLVSLIDIDRPAAEVWAVAGDFGGFQRFIPALSHIEMTGTGIGSLRTKFFKDGNRVVEQLNSRDEQAMSMTWTTLFNTLGVGQLWAALSVHALDAGHCRVSWTIIAEQAEDNPAQLPKFRRFVQDFADEAMSNLRQLFH